MNLQGSRIHSSYNGVGAASPGFGGASGGSRNFDEYGFYIGPGSYAAAGAFSMGSRQPSTRSLSYSGSRSRSGSVTGAGALGPLPRQGRGDPNNWRALIGREEPIIRDQGGLTYTIYPSYGQGNRYYYYAD